MLGFKSGGQKLTVEIDATSFKWTVFKGQGAGAEIVDIGAFPLSGSGDVLNQKIINIVKAHKIEAGDVVGCISRNQVTARNLELPSTDPEEIRKMFELQAAKQTPYAADQIVSDYYPIDSSHVDYSNIMLVVAHRQSVNEHLRILQEAGLKPQRVSLSSVDSASWVWHELSGGKGKAGVGPAAVLDIDSEDTDFFVCDKGKLLFTQNISIGFDKLAKEPEQWREKFLSEVARALEIFRGAEVARDISLFLFTGALEVLKPLTAPLQTIVGQAPRELPLPAGVRAILDGKKEESDPGWLEAQSFTSVMGLSRPNKESTIDLVPQEVLIQSALVAKGREVLVMGVLILLIVLAGIGFFGWKYYLQQSYSDWLDQNIHATDPDAQQVESTRLLIKEIVRLNSFTSGFFEDLLHIIGALPREMYLTELNLGKERTVDMRGRSDKMTSVFDFVNQLKSRPTFLEVETKQLTKRIVQNKEVVDFEIHCRLSAN